MEVSWRGSIDPLQHGREPEGREWVITVDTGMGHIHDLAFTFLFVCWHFLPVEPNVFMVREVILLYITERPFCLCLVIKGLLCVHSWSDESLRHR